MIIDRRQLLAMGVSASVAAPVAALPASAIAAKPAAPSGPLWSWSAADLARAIRRGDVSSREATVSALARLDAVNPRINAVVEVLADEALAAADLADKAVQASAPLGLLHGVPVTTKINVDLRGHPTTNGVVAMKDNIAKSDSTPVRNLRNAGAVIIGRTNTPAMSFRWFTENDLHGRTYNPWDRTITPGGSSGGAGSAVACGIGALAHGNDIAGSVRYPGYVCGVPAIRPSFGRVPSASDTGRGVTSAIMGVQGILGRHVEDLRIGLAALAERDPADPWFVPAPSVYPDTSDRTRVALFRRAPGYEPTAPVAASLMSAVKALSDAGYDVEEVDLPHFAEGQDLWSKLVMNEFRTGFGQSVAKYGDARVKKEVSAWLEITPPVDLDGFSAAMSRRELIAAAWQMLLEDYPVILMPNSWELPMKLDRDQGGPAAMRQILHIQSPMLLPAVLGLPGLSVPTGLSGGVPTGVQLVAARFREDRCFAAGEVVAAAHPMHTPIDPRGA